MLVDLVSAAQKEDWAELRNVLYKHWLTTCPKLYSVNNDQPWDNSGLNEKLINEQLFVPLVSAFCVDSQNTETTLKGLNTLAGTDPTKNSGQICGHVFKNGELTYTCMDCAQDGTCVMCLECFEASIHKNHKYRLHPSSGSGYCDCGDKDAWSDGYACTNHAKENEETQQIPVEILTRTRKIVEIILNYCVSLITQPEDITLPAEIERVRAEMNRDVSTASQYLTVLYNDETHTYDSVIKSLELYIHCTKDQAMLVATLVDREGRCAVKHGSKNDCTRAKEDFQRKKSSANMRRAVDRNLPLAVKVMDTVLFAHQNHAISLLSWLNSQMDVFPSLREIVGEAMLAKFVTEKEQDVDINEGQEQDNVPRDQQAVDEHLRMEVDAEPVVVEIPEIKSEPGSLVETVLLKDTDMWKAARSILHQMLMRTVFMNYDQKVRFSKAFIQHYDRIYNDFINDDHDMDVSVVGLSVQFLTVPALARQLVAEDDAFSVINRALINQTNKYIKDETNRFDFMGRSFPGELRRSLQISRDLAYILNAVPTTDGWSPDLKTNFVEGVRSFLTFLHHLQGMDEVKRQSGEHQIWESEWETAFNILLRIKDAISLIILWANTNKEVHNEVLLVCLEAMDSHPITSTDDNGGTHILVEVESDSTTLRSFDVLRGGVSIHQPIVRLISGLFSSPQFIDFINGDAENDVEQQIQNRIKQSGKDFYEMSLRVLVLCAQSVAQLWRRNGFSLVNQIHNYFSPLCRSEMFDRDVLMLQVGCALTPSRDFLLHLLQRYRLAQWAESSFEGFVKQTGRLDNAKMDTEDLSKITVTLAEEFFQLIILIIGERFNSGVGDCPLICSLKREVIHVLCTGSRTFSHIQQKMSHDVPAKRISLHEAVNSVADFRKPLSTSAGQFYLKEECLDQFNPFFMHYSRSDQSQAEQYQQKVRSKMDKTIQACVPPKLPSFTPFFEHIIDILRQPLLIRIIRLVIERTSKRNRFSSDRLFHKALYVIGMALNEEETNPKTFNFTGLAEETCGLIEALEGLQGKQESSICHLLLDQIVEKYKKLCSQKTGVSDEQSSAKSDKPATETAEEAKAKRAAKAAEMRKKAMAKMANMQSKFMKQMEDEEEKAKKDDQTTSNAAEKATTEKFTSDGKSDYDEDIVRQIGTDFPVCIGANRWKAEIVSERKLTCILCQEDEPVNPATGKPMVCAAFIQQSQLFTHKNRNGELMTSTSTTISTKDLLTAPATLQYGIDVSTCSHSMHFECYKTMFEVNKSRESLRARQQHGTSNKMVDPDEGEYLCPLCKRLSNSAIPILPATQITPIQGFSTVSGAKNEGFEDWVSRVKRQLDMPCNHENVRKKGHSRKRSHSERSLLDLEKHAQKEEETTTPSAGLLACTPHSDRDSSTSEVVGSTVAAVENEATNEFYNELAEMFLGEEPVSNVTSPINTPETTPIGGATPRSNESTPDRKPLSAQIQHALHNLILPLPTFVSNKFCGNGLEQYEESIKELGKSIIKFRRRGGNEKKTKFIVKHLRGYVMATVTWQSAAHVARAIASYLHYDGKPLFGALNTRQRDCLSAMARLCASLSHNLQFLPNAVSDMLRILCCQPPVGTSYSIPQSPPPGGASTSTTQASSSTNVTANFAFFMQLLNSGGPKKTANLNILQVDILSLAISLMMSIGWTWNNGIQSLNTPGNQKQRQLAPDGSVDESYVLRLSLIAHYFQIIATFEENDGNDVHMTEDDDESESSVDPQTVQILTKLFALSRPYETAPRKMDVLYKKLEEGAQILLRPIALIYHFLTLVDPPEALKDPSIHSSEPLFRYLNLPSKIEEQLSGALVENLFTMWSHAIPRDGSSRQEIVVQPVRPNLLVDLPLKYSQLINQVSTFRCPSIPIEESTSNVPTICLVCGQVLCSQAYCCQKVIEKQTYGACRYHMSQCSGSVGIFLRVRDCNLVLMTTRKRGCFRPAPYVDEFGESDQGFRRGNPLHLNKGLYQKLKQLWLQQGITEEVVNYNEIDFRNFQYDWGHF